MKEFKIGQRVMIVNASAAVRQGVDSFLGEEFIVRELHVNLDGSVEGMYKGYFIPAAACELVEDVIIHSEMVAALAKPGEDILASLTPEDCHKWHMGTGVAGEAGELLDAIKKAVIYRKPADLENIIEELGDLEFYMEGVRQAFGITREQTIEANIQKLGVRYAGLKYSDNAAQTRADKV